MDGEMKPTDVKRQCFQAHKADGWQTQHSNPDLRDSGILSLAKLQVNPLQVKAETPAEGILGFQKFGVFPIAEVPETEPQVGE